MSPPRRAAGLVLVVVACCAAPCLARPLYIVHFGDSVTQANYLPVSQQIETLTQASFREKFGTEEITCYNASKGGQDISESVGIGGWYKYHCKNIIPVVNVCFIQFGINNEDAYGPDKFERQTNLMCDTIEADYPGVQIILCTSLPDRDCSW